MRKFNRPVLVSLTAAAVIATTIGGATAASAAPRHGNKNPNCTITSDQRASDHVALKAAEKSLFGNMLTRQQARATLKAERAEAKAALDAKLPAEQREALHEQIRTARAALKADPSNAAAKASLVDAREQLKAAQLTKAEKKALAAKLAEIRRTARGAATGDARVELVKQVKVLKDELRCKVVTA